MKKIIFYLKKIFPKSIRRIIRYNLALRPVAKRECNICGFNGYFEHFAGPPLLNEVVCPSCGSHSRHRIFWDWYKESASILPEPIYHFAPEKVLEDKLRFICEQYVTADISDNADCILDIQNINLPSSSVGTVVCNHVLEHVPNDGKALSELYRVLRKGGILIISVPMIDGWEKSYEDASITSLNERAVNFGQSDHLRIYGRDFVIKLSNAGFSKIETVTAFGAKAVSLGLIRGEKIFVCTV